MVWNETSGVWVHSGMSGFTASGIYLEMQASDYYHHEHIRRSNPVIVDVGGHVGIFTREMARRYPQGRVLCIDPVAENSSLAEKNTAEFKNVTIINAAMTYEERVILHQFKPGSNSGGSQLRPIGARTFANDTKFGDMIVVAKITLEYLMQWSGCSRVDLLKLDCEGSEYSILKHANLDAVGEIVGEWHRVPDVPRFDVFCRENLPKWRLETWGALTGPLGMFRLTPGAS